jgi:hypothetical protein
MASVLVQVAGDSRNFQVSRKPTFGDLFHVAGATPHHINSATIQGIGGPLPHVPGQHQLKTV